MTSDLGRACSSSPAQQACQFLTQRPSTPHLPCPRCAAWESRSPLASLFQRVEAEVARLEAEAEELRRENATLARLLAEAELAELSRAAGPLPPDAASACRALHTKLKAAQRQAGRAAAERDALRQQLAAAARRDRLAELARRQAADQMRRAEETAGRLAAAEAMREQQSLAAAESAAAADALQGRLAEAEGQLAALAAQCADLQDANASLRSQVLLLRGAADRVRVLRHTQEQSQHKQPMPAPGVVRGKLNSNV